MKDKDKIVRKDEETRSYVNGRGEALKFTKKSVSIYSDTPDQKHIGTHINYDEKNGTLRVKTHNEDYSEKTEAEGKCYLTTSCIMHFQEFFNDNCYELTVLRWFRDNFVNKEDIKHYYEIAPIIVNEINKTKESDIIYDYIYDNIVDYCIKAIESGNYKSAYTRYKNSILNLEEMYVRPILEEKLIRVLKQII